MKVSLNKNFSLKSVFAYIFLHHPLYSGSCIFILFVISDMQILSATQK